MDDNIQHDANNYDKTLNVQRSMLVFTIFLSLVMGAVGGAGTVYLLANGNQLGSSLGVSNSVSLPVKQNITLEENSQFINVAKQVNPSVVSISSTSSVQDIFGQTYQQSGGGTGFIISSDGLIATNKHVVSDATAKYTVTLYDGTTYPATIKSTDPLFDFAVIKIDANNLKPLDLGDSDQLKVGQWVIAIGNALGQFQNTVTAGIISATERSITAGDSTGGQTESLEGLLQTDAAINPGNSGGPLLNLAGQVVGVNTAVSTSAQGIGFAIPINVLKPAIESVIKTGKIIRPELGVRYVSLNPQIASQNKLSVDHGAYLQPGSGNNQPAVVPGSAADKAGLKSGDIITAVNGQVVDNNHSLSNLIQLYSVGSKINITYYRNGKEQQTTVTLESTSS